MPYDPTRPTNGHPRKPLPAEIAAPDEPFHVGGAGNLDAEPDGWRIEMTGPPDHRRAQPFRVFYDGAELGIDSIVPEQGWAREQSCARFSAKLPAHDATPSSEDMAGWNPNGQSGEPRKSLQEQFDDALFAAMKRWDAKTTAKPLIEYQRITAKELAASHYETHWHIKGVLVRGQPCGIIAPKKTLKTSIAADLFFSLAVGGHFLGRFPVEAAARVLFMSGETALANLKDTLERVAHAAGRRLEDADNLIISPDLPRFGSDEHLQALERIIKLDSLEAIGIDPFYLTLDIDGREGSIFAMGKSLRSVSDLCRNLGVTLIILHHMRKGVANPYEPGDLDDSSWAGMAEFMRQWILLNRREKYVGGSGQHRLWMSLGGSAGHSSTWGLDIYEGVFDPEGQQPRVWEVALMSMGDVQQVTSEEKQTKKMQELDERAVADQDAIVKAIARLPEQRGTFSEIRTQSGINGQRFSQNFAALLNAKRVKLTAEQLTRGNNRRYDGYELVGDGN